MSLTNELSSLSIIRIEERVPIRPVDGTLEIRPGFIFFTDSSEESLADLPRSNFGSEIRDFISIGAVTLLDERDTARFFDTFLEREADLLRDTFRELWKKFN